MNITELKKNHYYYLTFLDEQINHIGKTKFYHKKELENFINNWNIKQFTIEIKPMLKNDDYYKE
jgi:hypothetical protein